MAASKGVARVRLVRMTFGCATHRLPLAAVTAAAVAVVAAAMMARCVLIGWIFSLIGWV